MLFVIVARRDNELVHDAPSIRTLIVLVDVVGGGVGTVVSVTLNDPSVTLFVPVAPVPATAARLNENVPTAVVDVRLVTVTVPLPMPTPACHPDAGLPTISSAFAALSGANT